jgi:tripartite-type tricarboxylate transporter receptor subunit TctC
MASRRQTTGLLALIGAAGVLGWGGAAMLGEDATHAAEKWPTRTIRLVVPSAPGAASDVFARAFAERLTATLKQQVIVDNRPGASGVIAAKTVMHSRADGYTFLYGTASSTVMVSALRPELGIDFTKDLEPVAATVFGGVLLAVNPELPAKDLKGLVALIKAHPGEYSYASWGIGTNGHLTMEWLKSRTGMRIQHVPYKGIAPILTELSTGIVKIGWVDPVSALPFIKSGKIRPIAANGAVRTAQLPNLPTMDEQGYPFPGTGWQGILAPKGTPRVAIDRINGEVNKMLASPELKELTFKLNVEPPEPRTLDQFRALLVHDLQVWHKIITDANIKVN